MQRDYDGIVTRRMLGCALRHEKARVAARKPELAHALRADQRQKDESADHAALLMTAQLAEKPGPIDSNADRGRNPRRSWRSRTNNTVGADMLP